MNGDEPPHQSIGPISDCQLAEPWVRPSSPSFLPSSFPSFEERKAKCSHFAYPLPPWEPKVAQTVLFIMKEEKDGKRRMSGKEGRKGGRRRKENPPVHTFFLCS